MCVLTYIPTNSGYFATSNRDEATARTAAIPPKSYEINGQVLYFPKDPQGGGTWFATNGNQTVCLLNGGYKNHVRKLPYRQSRGLVVLDFFGYDSVKQFYKNYTFDDIEPFTLVVFDGSETIQEIRWTGTKTDLNALDGTQPQIWSSATLYSDEIIAERKAWFFDFLANEIVTENSILDFHNFGGRHNEQNAIRMNRNEVLKTVAITQFTVSTEQCAVRYEDLQANRLTAFDFSYSSSKLLISE